MQCEAFENRLQQVLDERQLPEEDAVLADHAAACPNCRDVLDAQAGLFDTVRDWSVANLEVDLVDRVLVRAAPAASSPRHRSWWPARWRVGSARWISIAVAAALAVVAWKGYELYGPRVARPTPAENARPSGGAPKQLAPWSEPESGLRTPIEIDVITREAAEELGSRIARGVHYIHRGRAAVTGVILSQFPRKVDEPSMRSSSSLLLRAVRCDAIALA